MNSLIVPFGMTIALAGSLTVAGPLDPDCTAEKAADKVRKD